MSPVAGPKTRPLTVLGPLIPLLDLPGDLISLSAATMTTVWGNAAPFKVRPQHPRGCLAKGDGWVRWRALGGDCGNPAPPCRLQYADELKATAKAIATPGKGILAADESTGTIGKRVRGKRRS